MDKLVSAFASLAWPIVVGAGLWYFRIEALNLFQSLRRQINAGATVKVKDVVEIKGVKLEEIKNEARANWVYARESATKQDYEYRDQIYQECRNIFLVHTAVRTADIHPENGFPLFEVSIFLMPHQRYAQGSDMQQFGRLNEIDEVDYYLGKYWGGSEFGRRYKVRNASDGFAVRFRGYGPSLCVATVKFHDGTIKKLQRYIDFESAGGMKRAPS